MILKMDVEEETTLKKNDIIKYFLLKDRGREYNKKAYYTLKIEKITAS
jgi:hypothetical protein